ncbi:hypothetical protein A3J23_02775 [Candidatus Peregrinibacteria bacterium RIFCSPLOWO2_02_FULL_48_14]|nr:MAG: hypothetical protein A3J23_02775 [Candidatus Peregrinibacteria bacterium RIFCSPLOWO2_02_FULL_48_14]
MADLSHIMDSFEPEYDPSQEKTIQDWKAEMGSLHSAELRQIERGDPIDDAHGIPGNPAPANQRKAAYELLKDRG